MVLTTLTGLLNSFSALPTQWPAPGVTLLPRFKRYASPSSSYFVKANA
jgi:hypothetical protein